MEDPPVKARLALGLLLRSVAQWLRRLNGGDGGNWWFGALPIGESERRVNPAPFSLCLGVILS